MALNISETSLSFTQKPSVKRVTLFDGWWAKPVEAE